MDSDDDRKPAIFFETGDEDYDLNVPPVSGSEYLRRVQKEAKQCPQVVVADVEKLGRTLKPADKLPSHGVQPSPSELKPSIKWQQKQISDFTNLRQRIVKFKCHIKKKNINPKYKVPLIDNVQGWCMICFGQNPSKMKRKDGILNKQSDNEKEDVANFDDDEETKSYNEQDNFKQSRARDDQKAIGENGFPPFLSIVGHLTQPEVIQLLEYHINWFEVTGMSERQGQWFYALLACLEKPLTPEVCSSLRSLARNCANLRATLDDPSDSLLTPLNLFICLVARYFDQMDLVDCAS